MSMPEANTRLVSQLSRKYCQTFSVGFSSGDLGGSDDTRLTLRSAARTRQRPCALKTLVPLEVGSFPESRDLWRFVPRFGLAWRARGMFWRWPEGESAPRSIA